MTTTKWTTVRISKSTKKGIEKLIKIVKDAEGFDLSIPEVIDMAVGDEIGGYKEIEEEDKLLDVTIGEAMSYVEAGIKQLFEDTIDRRIAFVIEKKIEEKMGGKNE